MRVKKSFNAYLVALLLAGILVAPAAASAYNGGFPPIVGVGPRIEQMHERLARASQRLRQRVAAFRARIFSVFPGGAPPAGV